MNKDADLIRTYMSKAKRVVCNKSGGCGDCPFLMKDNSMVCEFDALGFLAYNYLERE